MLNGTTPTEDAIVHEARENWHPDKLNYPVSRFLDAIKTIRSQGIEPDGSGKRVGGQDGLHF